MPKIEDYERDIERLSATGLILYYAIFNDHGTSTQKKSIPKEYLKKITGLRWAISAVVFRVHIAPFANSSRES